MSAIARIALPLSLFVLASREDTASQRYSPTLCPNRIDSVSRSRLSRARQVKDLRQTSNLARRNYGQGQPSHPNCRRSRIREVVSSPGSNEMRARADEIYFRHASNELTRRNDQFRNDTILTLPQQTPETGLEHDRGIDLRHRF